MSDRPLPLMLLSQAPLPARPSLPASFLVLRTLKGEIMVGLPPSQAGMLATQDPTWLISGKRGIIQLETVRRDDV